MLQGRRQYYVFGAACKAPCLLSPGPAIRSISPPQKQAAGRMPLLSGLVQNGGVHHGKALEHTVKYV
ncbi:hypothetical protein CHU92_10245 [Flavobacterium cyanobacteriorum]|uniref:Uncharacterized protein n=1 Tax=Flavobacterium cyanobacteriorum TaxID=2022802 RepID=A0A255Z3R7_9FLAO|nr:hypothetical protein CHU92_10245 [Flavobacterium cyanobacteriorum]